jgi:phytoene dehydrogenase-like protein
VTTVADVVVAGAGHNALVTAAYLARSGREVVVLDARPVPGGGAATEELFPGYMIDTASTGHNGIQVNPLIADDELGLVADHGLTYVRPDPVSRVAFPDGEILTTWLDVDRTVAELARFSRADAGTYRRMLDDWGRVKAIFGRARNQPVGWGPPVDQELDAVAGGGVWRRRKALSAWEVVGHEYEDRHVQAFVLWAVSQSLTSVDLPGSGLLTASAPAGRQDRSWTIPLGGSAALTTALVRSIESDGGTVLCGQRVSRLVLEGDRCTGVETERGDRFIARQAVVSSIHVRHLIEMAPTELWGDDFVYGVRTLDLGLPLFVVHLATTEPPRFTGHEDAAVAVASGLAGWPEQLVRANRSIRDGGPSEGFPSVLVGTPTAVDPSRAPDGRHTVKLVTAAGAVPPPPATTWDEGKEEHADRLVDAVRLAAPNLTGAVILHRQVMSPLDLERWNPHMIGGTAHGGDRGIPFSGALRPAPGWAQHRMPVHGLYQTGGTTHPGGSITGVPGRNAAMVVLRDLGDDLARVVGS